MFHRFDVSVTKGNVVTALVTLVHGVGCLHTALWRPMKQRTLCFIKITAKQQKLSSGQSPNRFNSRVHRIEVGIAKRDYVTGHGHRRFG
jgi:hypothetical protein